MVNATTILQSIAHRAMIERGLPPDLSTQVLAELGGGRAREKRIGDRRTRAPQYDHGIVVIPKHAVIPDGTAI